MNIETTDAIIRLPATARHATIKNVSADRTAQVIDASGNNLLVVYPGQNVELISYIPTNYSGLVIVGIGLGIALLGAYLVYKGLPLAWHIHYD